VTTVSKESGSLDVVAEPALEEMAWPDTGCSGMGRLELDLKYMTGLVTATCAVSQGVQVRQCVDCEDWSHTGYCRWKRSDLPTGRHKRPAHMAGSSTGSLPQERNSAAGFRRLGGYMCSGSGIAQGCRKREREERAGTGGGSLLAGFATGSCRVAHSAIHIGVLAPEAIVRSHSTVAASVAAQHRIWGCRRLHRSWTCDLGLAGRCSRSCRMDCDIARHSYSAGNKAGHWDSRTWCLFPKRGRIYSARA